MIRNQQHQEKFPMIGIRLYGNLKAEEIFPPNFNDPADENKETVVISEKLLIFVVIELYKHTSDNLIIYPLPVNFILFTSVLAAQIFHLKKM